MNAADRKYWEAVAELDVIHAMLEETLKAEQQRSAIDRMIDKATGYDAKKLADAQKLMRRAKVLKKRIEQSA